MKLYDRYRDKYVQENNLPDQIDFGRYCIIDDRDNYHDITYSNYQTNKVIHQYLLSDKFKNLQEIFVDMAIDIDKAGNDNFSVIPLIRRIKNKLGLTEFEKLLFGKIYHIEEIFRVPHYLLTSVIEKVHVSRVKKIPSKSYQYLASHTEDWIHKSIVNFKPGRILHEELEMNFDIYENQLTIALLERSLVYLNSRLKEIQDIKSFLHEYEKLLKNRNDQTGWYKKINRNLSLIGSVYEDEHFHGINKDGSILTETEETLYQINKRLQILRKSDLFELVNKRSTHGIFLRNTNVIVNHKHYRYVKSLWIELDKIKPEKSISEKMRFEQNVMNGLRSYGKCLISYCLEKYLGYELHGNYNEFNGQHSKLININFICTDKGICQIEIGNYKINFIIVGNKPNLDDNLYSLFNAQHTYILYYDEQSKNTNPSCRHSMIINVNPIDPDSAERVGAVIRKYLLLSYLEDINRPYRFKQLLKEYIKYIPIDFLKFDKRNYTYKFHSYPKNKLDKEDILKRIECDPTFKARGKIDRDNITKSIDELVDEIESNIKSMEDYYYCFNCGEKLHSYNFEKHNYIKCPSCNCLIDSSQSEKMVLKVDDSKLANLSTEKFGIDYFEISECDL